MKSLLAVLLIILAAYEPTIATAQPGGYANDRSHGQMQRQRRDGSQRRPQQDVHSAESPPPPQREVPRDGRLTQEERQELRRDIDRADREIYKSRPQ